MDTPASPRAPLMSPAEVSAYLGVPTSTLAVWRSTGRVCLPFLKVGAHVRYRREVVDAFLEGEGLDPAPISQRPLKIEPQAPKALEAQAEPPGRLTVYLKQRDRLKCQHCTADTSEADAVICSELELPGLPEPRDPHDWHCFCRRCHKQLSATNPEVAAKQRPVALRSAASTSQPNRMPATAP